jgi:transcriptional regulator with XRE-family HTH domain
MVISKLEILRREHGLTQTQLARRSHVDQRYISDYETRFRKLEHARLVTICRLAAVLGVKAWEIIDDEWVSNTFMEACKIHEIDHDENFDGTRLKEMRLLNNMTQKDVAEYSHIAQTTICKWERGDISTAHIFNIAVISCAVECHPLDLIDDDALRDEIREACTHENYRRD